MLELKKIVFIFSLFKSSCIAFLLLCLTSFMGCIYKMYQSMAANSEQSI